VIRLTWLQFRMHAVVALVGLLALAVVSVVTGPYLVHLYDAIVRPCAVHGDCSEARTTLLRHDTGLRTWLGILVVVTPGIIGVFWGAPLVSRELEAGTFRMAWTQTVTRTRWLVTRVVVVGLAGVAVTGLLSLAVSWWAGPLDRATLDQFVTFDQRDIVPLGHAAFAFTLGVAAGVLIRRTLPAMATTMVGFLAVRLSFNHWVRPHLIGPVLHQSALNARSTGFGSSGSLFGGSSSANLMPEPPNMPNAWITSTRIVDRAGHDLTTQVLKADCPHRGQGGGPGPSGGNRRGPAPQAVVQALHDCVTKVGATYHEAVTYQPAHRYWSLQWLELAVYIGAAVLLAAFSTWWVRRRLG
jgi:hypothetical protein